MTYEEAIKAIPLGRYRHFKGNRYEVTAIARHSETEEAMVVYRALYGDGGVWVRPASMWQDVVEREGKRFLRFSFLEDGAKYRFYGWEKADITDARGLTPRDYYDLLAKVWCADTCAPRMRADWTEENRTCGQCSITAFLLQDIFGGEVRGILRKGGNYHCFNVVGDCVFDLTSEQFGNEVLDYTDCPVQERSVHFAKEEKRLRYEKLKEGLEKLLEEKK